MDVGVIGLGKMGLLHAAIFNRLDGCHVTALCDINELMLKILRSGNEDVRTYTDYKLMLDENDLDIVVIATPVFLHGSMATTALKKGMHVLIEKPMAKTSEECSNIIGNANGSKSLVGYCRRFMPTYNNAKKLIESEELGKVLSFRSHFYLSQVDKRMEGWQFDPYKGGGGALIDLGCHALDMIHYILGPMRSVSCRTERVISESVEDIARLELTLCSGVTGNLAVSWVESGYRLPEMMLEVTCEKGVARVAEKYLETVSNDGTVNKRFKQCFPDPIPFNIGGREYTAEDLHLVQSVRDAKDTKCDIKVGSMPTSVIDSAYLSARDGQPHKVRYL